MKIQLANLVSTLLLAAASSATAAELPVKITVTSEVLRPASALEPLGVNCFGDSGGTPVSNGNLISQSGFEPATMRNLYRVIQSGEENGHRWITLDGPSTINWLQYCSGTYSGAQMRVYRFLDASGQPLPFLEAKKAEGGAIIDLANAAACVPLLTTRVLPKGTPGLPDGGWVANGTESIEEWKALPKEKKAELIKSGRVYYDSSEPLRMDDVVIFSREFIWPDASDFHPRLAKKPSRSRWDSIVGQARFVPTPSGAPPEFHEGVLQLTPENGIAQVWHKLFGGPGRKDAIWYGTLEEGLTYRYEAWVKGESGTITLGFGQNDPNALAKGYFGDASLTKNFPVTNTWTRVGFEFKAPATPPEGGIEGVILRYEGAGTLLVDNVKLQPVYEPGDADKSFVINRQLLDALLANQPSSGRKGAARIWSGLSQSVMSKLLASDPSSTVQLSDTVQLGANGRTTIPHALKFLEATGTSPETRMVPWIITQITHTEEEYLQLVEYLAAPYDPAIDTPKSKPLAFLRTQQRGHNRPWSEDFRQIIIELGNENWHNRAMDDWIGLGRHGTVHGAGPEYGLWGKHMIETMQKSPHWKAGQMRVCFGGNYQAEVLPDGSVSGYGELATQAAKGANQAIGHATYIGPRWETGEASQTSIDDAGVQKTLFSHRSAKAEEWDKAAAALEKLRSMGHKVDFFAYEGGPSGFGLRAKNPEEDRAGEYYGKSYAMGTAMLDSALDAWAKGWTYQCYHSFGQGKWWNSHTTTSQGFRPSPSWLVQTLINHTLANRDMLKTEVTGEPVLTLDVPVKGKKGQFVSKQVSTIQAHSFGDASTVAVAVSNLDLTSPATLEIHLPIASAKSITLHTLTGGPRDTNLDTLAVSLESKPLEATLLKDGVFTAAIQPGSPAVFVFEKPGTH